MIPTASCLWEALSEYSKSNGLPCFQISRHIHVCGFCFPSMRFSDEAMFRRPSPVRLYVRVSMCSWINIKQLCSRAKDDTEQSRKAIRESEPHLKSALESLELQELWRRQNLPGKSITGPRRQATSSPSKEVLQTQHCYLGCDNQNHCNPHLWFSFRASSADIL